MITMMKVDFFVSFLSNRNIYFFLGMIFFFFLVEYCTRSEIIADSITFSYELYDSKEAYSMDYIAPVNQLKTMEFM